MLVENYSYTPIFGQIESLGVVKIPFPMIMETGGPVIDIAGLTEILETWNTGPYAGSNKPKVIYTVPTQNPLGLTQPRSTMLALYQLCQEHDLLIFEDDPDGYISFDSLDTFEDYRKSLQGSSYLQMDVDGRVFRMETFSKLFCPGIRLGFIASRSDAISKLTDFSKIFTKTASGISQLMLIITVNHLGGGATGYLKWCYEVSKEYKSRRDAFFTTINTSESVKKGYITPVEPDGGMFFVLRYSLAGSNDIQRDMEQLYYRCLKAGVVIILGREMSWETKLKDKATFIRVTLTSQPNIEACIEGARRLNEAFLDYFEQIWRAS